MGDVKSRILPDVHYGNKTKTAQYMATDKYGNGQMDDSIIIQPEHQRMNITTTATIIPTNSNVQSNINSNNIIVNNNNAFGAGAAGSSSGGAGPSSLYHRRRNSSNSRQSPLDLVSSNGLPHRVANGRLVSVNQIGKIA